MYFEPPNTKEMLVLEARANDIRGHMKVLDYPLNNNQLGLCFGAAMQLARKQFRQVYTVPAG